MIQTAAVDISHSLDELAARIQDYDNWSALRVRALSDAVKTGNDDEAWADVDVMHLVDPRMIAERVQRLTTSDRLLSNIEMLRNTIIFLPIMVTWFGISLAVDSYYELLRERPELDRRPFLFLWQGGFEGRLAWLPLSTLGLYVAGLLLIVFALTLLALGRSLWLRKHAQNQGEDLSAQLTHVLAQAILVLKRRYAAQPVSLVSGLQQALRDQLTQMEYERQRLTSLSDQRQGELDTIGALVSELKHGSGEFAAAAQAIHQASGGLAASIGGLAQPTQTIATQGADLLAAAVHVVQLLETVSGQQQSIGVRLSAATDTLATTSTAVANAARSATTVADQMLLSQSQFLAAAAGDREKHGQIADALSATSGRLEAAAQAFKLSYNALANSVMVMTAPTQELAQHSATLATSAQGLLKPLLDLGELQQTTGGLLRSSSDQLSMTGAELAVAASDIAKIADSFVSSQRQFLQELEKERQAQERMAAMVALSAGQLEATFGQIQVIAPAIRAISLDLNYMVNNRVNGQP